MLSKKNIFYSWLWLIALTLTSVYLSQVVHFTNIFVLSVLLIVMLKGLQITDIFMELLHAPTFWRWLLLGYVIIVPLIIAVIYIIF